MDTDLYQCVQVDAEACSQDDEIMCPRTCGTCDYPEDVELDDPASVTQSIGEFALFIKSDLFVVTNNDGTVIGWLNNTNKINTDKCSININPMLERCFMNLAHDDV